MANRLREPALIGPTGRAEVEHRGPPPCQTPDCPDDSHFRNGYIYCLDHDSVDIPGWDAEPEPTGIATDEFTFYFGASCGSSRKTLRQLEEPNVMLSYATRTNTPWDAIENLMVDSGGYSLLQKGDLEYPDDVDQYLDYVQESEARYFVTRDLPAAPDIVAQLDRGTDTAISWTLDLTEETLEAYWKRDMDAQPMAVLQGTTPDDYVQCYHELVAQDLLTGRVAIGSLKPHTTAEQVAIVTRVREQIDADTDWTEDRIELHGLGVDVDALRHPGVRRALSSADSSRYISTARWRANRDELPPRLRDDEPRTGWYEVLRAYLEMREDLRDVFDPDAGAVDVPDGQGRIADFATAGGEPDGE